MSICRMIAYFKKYTVYISYMFIFLFSAGTGYLQKASKERPFERDVAQSCMTTLFYTFYTCCYFLCHRHTETNEERVEEVPNVGKNVILWYYTYAFCLGVFCASFSIDMTNYIASFFFCLGSVISSSIKFFQQEYDHEDTIKKNKGGILFLMVSMWCLYFFSFSFWFYNYHDYMTTEWRHVWIEIIGPLMAPFWIVSFKRSDPVKGGVGYVLFSMPLLAFISLLFLTLYQSTEPLVTMDNMLVTLFMSPLAVFTSLVVYVGACGRRENYIICTSSQAMVFFISSYVNIPGEDGRILPCCVMSFLCFMISVLLSILRVYFREIGDEIIAPCCVTEAAIGTSQHESHPLA